MDPRAAHTRRLLEDAVLALAAERPLDEIPVTDIVARAGVNRSSFYQHYADREELLAQALESLEDAAARISAPVAVLGDGPPPELLRFAAHFAEHAALYRQALGPHGSARVAARVRARTLELVREGIALDSQVQDPALPLGIAAAGTAGALHGIIDAWLAIDPLPDAAVAAEWMWRTLTAGGRAARPGPGARP
ncbi:TetR/AcrR family transcriptional regulator [Leucobacter allii]|uniref:TetR/AcrR family transcriptional regulator n=1 Tax=Leucobacter allii TaxID=2932247 RepID=UPI001FD51DE3|nr:TetR/AcrR family transcriptional regulator [Leucobacter allii]UOR00246.1 TetR/AcrR family transcriptional regulator [Leucobacter allii]